MVGEVKQRDPKQRDKQQQQQRKKRKDASSSEKHKLSLADQMDDTREMPAKNRAVKNRKLQETEEYVNPKTSNRILAEAQRQQQEIEQERDEETGVAAARRVFSTVVNNKISNDSDSDDEGYSDTDEPLEEIEEISEEEERIMAMFMVSDAGPQRTLADMIMERIQEKDAGISSAEIPGDGRVVPGLDAKVTEVFTGVGKLLSRYRAGKLPKAFKIVPSLSNWEEVLYLTEPEKWTPNAMYQATRLFASNLNAHMAQRFYNLVLLPRVREDIEEHKRLHFAIYQALKKAVYKPSAFYKGILLPLCQSRTCNLREAVIIGSVIEKVSIPVLHSSVALLKIAEMEYCGTNSYFMKLLMNKKYALPYRVLDAMVGHFLRFADDERDLPVIWHQCLLTFVQRYKNELSEEDKDNLKRVMRQHKHYLVTPEIHRELQNSRHRGQKEGHIASGQSSVFPTPTVKAAAMDEDIWNLPEVQIGMDED